VVRSPALLLVGTFIAGIGFGPVFVGAFRTVLTLAPADDRAGLVAAIFTVAYLGFGVPALAAGFATSRFGLHSTALVYCAAVVALAGVALVSLFARRRTSADVVGAAGACPPAAPCTRAHCARPYAAEAPHTP
jgi:MFS family permease